MKSCRLPFHHSSFQLHCSFRFCSFVKVTCEPSDRVKKWISRWNYWRRPREQTSSVFSLHLLWFIHMVSALAQTDMLLSDDSLESLTSEYWTEAWFISQRLQTWCFFGSRAAPEVARSIRNAESSFWLQMGTRSHGHPHTGTQGSKTKPSQPALDVSFSLDTIQTPLHCVLWNKPSISADSGWLTLHIERPLAVGPPARYSSMWICDFVLRLCPLAALPLCQLSPGLSPSQISLRDPLLAVQFIPPGVLKHCCLFTSGLRLLYVSNVTAASFISQVWRPWDKTDMALQSFSLRVNPF